MTRLLGSLSGLFALSAMLGAALPELAAAQADASQTDAPQPDVLSPAQWRRLDRSTSRGLDYLVSQQDADGAFRTHPHGQPAVTALATLAFLQHGHLPGQGPYGEAIERAIAYTLGCQRPNGLLARIGPNGPIVPTPLEHEVGVAASYNHAIAGLMLGEVYGMTGPDDRLREPIERALDVTVKMQRWRKQRAVDHGGWRYFHPFTNRDSDLSVVGWHLKFLRSAKNAGFEPPEQAINDAVAYVLRCYTPRYGTFEYEASDDDRRTRAMAGAGILALAHTSRHDRPEAVSAANWILTSGFESYNRQAQIGNFRYQSDRYHYGVFYCTLAMYQIGGEHWQRFFPPTAETLVANQNADGSWDAESVHDQHFGQAYTSSLVLLALGAPNQLLPIYQR